MLFCKEKLHRGKKSSKIISVPQVQVFFKFLRSSGNLTKFTNILFCWQNKSFLRFLWPIWTYRRYTQCNESGYFQNWGKKILRGAELDYGTHCHSTHLRPRSLFSKTKQIVLFLNKSFWMLFVSFLSTGLNCLGHCIDSADSEFLYKITLPIRQIKFLTEVHLLQIRMICVSFQDQVYSAIHVHTEEQHYHTAVLWMMS